MVRLIDTESYEKKYNFKCQFRCQGGAKVGFLQRSMPRPGSYDIVVFSIGSNDLSRGIKPVELMAELQTQALLYLNSGACRFVIIMGLWPRKSSFFNTLAREFNLLTCADSRVTFWKWPKKFKVKILADKVHLYDQCYRRAVKYLASPILYVTKYLLPK